MSKTVDKPKSKAAAKKEANPLLEHPTYQDMISKAIVNLKERNGSSLPAIKKYLATEYNLPEGWDKKVLLYIKKMTTDGRLLKVKSSYKLGESLKKKEKKKAIKATAIPAKPKVEKKVAKKDSKPKAEKKVTKKADKKVVKKAPAKKVAKKTSEKKEKKVAAPKKVEKKDKKVKKAPAKKADKKKAAPKKVASKGVTKKTKATKAKKGEKK